MNGRILLLAGSAEARRIAQTLQAQGMDVVALVSEPPRGPDPMPVPCTLCRFDDPSALAWRMVGCDAVIDASHGFDGMMSATGHAAAHQAGVPFVSLARPVWPLDAANWHHAADVPAALALIAPLLIFVLLTFIAVFGDPPFDVAQEQALFQDLAVDLLICRNLGGLPSRPKIDAARKLGLPVILIDRPAPPKGAQVVSSIEAVLAWVADL